MKLTRKILEEASKITEYIEPDDEFNPVNEKILGVMSEENKKIYTYAMQARERGKTILDLIEKTDSLSERKRLTERGDKIAEFGTFLDKLRWAELRYQFQDAGQVPNIGVRKGFKVVSINQEKPSFPDFLKGLGLIE